MPRRADMNIFTKVPGFAQQTRYVVTTLRSLTPHLGGCWVSTCVTWITWGAPGGCWASSRENTECVAGSEVWKGPNLWSIKFSHGPIRFVFFLPPVLAGSSSLLTACAGDSICTLSPPGELQYRIFQYWKKFLTELRVKKTRNKTKQRNNQRKAYNSVLCTFNAEMSSRFLETAGATSEEHFCGQLAVNASYFHSN